MELDLKDHSVKHFVENKWIDLREVWYDTPEGRVSGPYYTYSRKNYCVIVATDETVAEQVAEAIEGTVEAAAKEEAKE